MPDRDEPQGVGVMSRRRFKDSSLQRLYDQYRETPPTTKMTGLGSAYYLGRNRPDAGPTRCTRGSLAYAAWAAGVDNAKASGNG